MGLDVHDISANPILNFQQRRGKSMAYSKKSLLKPTKQFVVPCTSDAALLES